MIYMKIKKTRKRFKGILQGIIVVDEKTNKAKAVLKNLLKKILGEPISNNSNPDSIFQLLIAQVLESLNVTHINPRRQY